MLVGLQYLRAFAAVLVVFYHLIISAVFHDRWFNEFPGLIGIGQIGVDVFFVLSGFIITYSMYNKGILTSKFQFIILRIIRIYPMYWLYTLILLALFLSPFTKEYTFDLGFLLKSMALFPAYNNDGELYPLLIVGWTLICEMYFYFVFCVCRTSDKWKTFIYVSLSFALIIVIAKYCFSENAITQFLSQSVFFEFSAGMLIYNIFSHREGSQLIHNNKNLIRIITIFSFAILLFYWEELSLFRGVVSAFFSIFALLLALTISTKNSTSISKLFALIGDASYSLYLSHILFVMFITGLWKRGILVPAYGFEILYFILITSICIVFSILSYKILEVKINKRASHFFKNKF